MQVITFTTVSKCIDCPHYQPSMDGPYCLELAMSVKGSAGYVLPEGRHQIHPLCPINKVQGDA